MWSPWRPLIGLTLAASVGPGSVRPRPGSFAMSRQTLLFAVASAMLLPIGSLLVLALNPYASFTTGIRVVLDRVGERPASGLNFTAA